MSVVVAAASLADEGGVSFWVPGSYGSFAAERAEPGWSLSVSDYYTAVSAGASVARSREIETGRFPVGLSAAVNAKYSDMYSVLYIEPTYVFATPVFGGQVAIGVSGYYGRDSGSLTGTLTGSLTAGGVTMPFARSDAISQAVWGFGDLAPVISLRWQQGSNNFMTHVAGNIPVGAYDPARLTNLGIGHGATDEGGAIPTTMKRPATSFPARSALPTISSIRRPNTKAASTCTSTGAPHSP